MDVEDRLGRWLLESHPEDAARILTARDDLEVAECLLDVVPDSAARVLRHLGTMRAALLAEHLDDSRLAAVLDAMPRPVAVAVLRAASGERRDRFLGGLPERSRDAWLAALSQGGKTAGALMDVDVLIVHASQTVADGVRLVEEDRRRARHYLYIVDDELRLVGVVGLRELFLAGRKQAISTVMKTEVDTLSVDAGYGSVVSHPGWRQVHSLPVVDRDGILLGIIRYKTLRRLEEEMAGAADDESTTVAALGDLFWTGVAG